MVCMENNIKINKQEYKNKLCVLHTHNCKPTFAPPCIITFLISILRLRSIICHVSNLTSQLLQNIIVQINYFLLLLLSMLLCLMKTLI